MRKIVFISISLLLLSSSRSWCPNEAVAQEEGVLEDESLTPDEMIAKYKGLIRKNPKDYLAHRLLANVYLMQGKGEEAVYYLKKAVAINPQRARADSAYVAMGIGHYYAGDFKESYSIIKTFLEFNPDHELAQGFMNMLKEVSEQQFDGKIPEKINFGGYGSAGEIVEAVKSQGSGLLGQSVDKAIFDFTTLVFTPPEGWNKKANIPFTFSRAILLYEKEEDESLPAIVVTRENLKEKIENIEAYTANMSFGLAEKMPDLKVDEIKQVTVGGRKASFLLMRNKKVNMSTAWYQFLFDGNVVSLQLITPGEQYKKNLKVFEEFVENMKEE